MNRVVVPARQATWAGGIDSSGLLKSLKIPALLDTHKESPYTGNIFSLTTVSYLPFIISK